jgi:hypothetical protein
MNITKNMEMLLIVLMRINCCDQLDTHMCIKLVTTIDLHHDARSEKYGNIKKVLMSLVQK